MAKKLVQLHSQDGSRSSSVWLVVEHIESVHPVSDGSETVVTMISGTRHQVYGSAENVIQLIKEA